MKVKFDILKNGIKIGRKYQKVYAEQIGNFNPLFVRFNNKFYLLKSYSRQDLSDPFRREETNDYYINIEVCKSKLTKESDNN